MGFKLEVQGFGLEIALVAVSKVHIHEEIIPEPLEELVRDIKSIGKVRNPVIVDSNTRVVLDGMHRVAAVREIGCRYLPVCLVDYQDSNVMVGCWYRVIRGKPKPDESVFLDMSRSLGLEVKRSSLGEALEALEERSATIAFMTAKNCHLLNASRMDIRESYKWVKRLEQAILDKGFDVGYERDSEAERQVISDKALAALLVPRVRKDEVIKAALTGKVFAHKTTRHVLPVRPMGVEVPLRWLTGDKPLGEVNRELTERLSKLEVDHVPPGSFFEDRYYEEELLVFR